MRIRQIVFAAAELSAGAARLGTLLGLATPYRDPGVAEFGLDNAVFVFGDQFIEIVSPTRAGTTAGRLVERRGDCCRGSKREQACVHAPARPTRRGR